MGELKMATGTYKQIQEDVRKRHGIVVKTCWIAHVKELNGLNPRLSPNRQSSLKRIQPCPQHIQPIIEESMRYLGILLHKAEKHLL